LAVWTSTGFGPRCVYFQMPNPARARTRARIAIRPRVILNRGRRGGTGAVIEGRRGGVVTGGSSAGVRAKKRPPVDRQRGEYLYRISFPAMLWNRITPCGLVIPAMAAATFVLSSAPSSRAQTVARRPAAETPAPP